MKITFDISMEEMNEAIVDKFNGVPLENCLSGEELNKAILKWTRRSDTKRFSCPEFVFERASDAGDFIDRLKDTIDKCGHVSVRWAMMMNGYQKYNEGREWYGWRDLANVKLSLIEDFWHVILPEPEDILHEPIAKENNGLNERR